MARYKVKPVIYKSKNDNELREGYRVVDKRYGHTYTVHSDGERYSITYYDYEEAKRHCDHLNGKDNSILRRIIRLFSITGNKGETNE